MDEICRLCLSVSTNMAGTISEDSEISYQLSCLNIQITMCDYLPSKVCQTCFKILKDIQNFHESITQNEYKLIELLNNGQNLDTFYYNLKSQNHKIKYEELNKPKEDFVLIHFIELDTKIKVEDRVAELKEIKIGYGQLADDDVDPISDLNVESFTNKEVYLREDAIDVESSKIETHNITNLTEIPETKENANSGEDDDMNEVSDEKCVTCFQKFTEHIALLKHYKSVHFNRYIENCGDADYSVQMGDKNEFKCNHCGKLYETVDGVVGHLNEHKSDRPYMCKICGRTFKQVFEIVRHGRSHSTDHQLYCLRGCGYHTTYKGALQDHHRRHSKEYKYKCETCGAGFFVRTWFEQHQNIHNNVKPFACDLCGSSFHMQRYLTSHRSALHPQSGTGVKRYICPHCGLSCYNKHGLSLHLEEHDIKKKFLCDICGKQCSSKEHLKNHRNSHLGVKPFTCSTCNKSFAKKFNLTLHEKAHSGQKHLCQSCGKYFAQRSSLVRHTKKRHPNGAEESTKKE